MLLHSDIARLVLGYLAEANCPQTYQSFLNENEHLKGMRHVLSGELPNTAPVSIFGKSLCGIIDEYYSFKDAEMQVWSFKNRSHGRNQRFLSMWKKLEDALAIVKSFQIASILDGYHVKRLHCRNCERAMTESGIVLTPTTPQNLLLNQSTDRKEFTPDPFSPDQSHNDLFSSTMQTPPDPEPCTSTEANRRKKKRSAPKKLSDFERKNKETELRADPSSLLLKNITGSETMAVVGATIMSQMKKCTKADNSSEIVDANGNHDIDAVAAKHNQQSIAQLSLESLLHSDFGINEMEFGKELEELLGIPHPNKSTDKDQETENTTASKIDKHSQPSKPNSMFFLGNPLVVKVSKEAAASVNASPSATPASPSPALDGRLLPSSDAADDQDLFKMKSLSDLSFDSIENETKSKCHSNNLFEAFADEKLATEIIPPSSLGFNPNIETINDSEIPIVSNSVVIDGISFDEIQDKAESIPHTPTKRKLSSVVVEESPAKNTRSKTKPLLTRSNIHQKTKTPKVVIRRKKNNKKTKKPESKTSSRKNERKSCKKTSKTDNSNSEVAKSATSPPKFEDPHLSDFSTNPLSDSPKNVLAAVNLQNSPRKLTLRYGLRSTGGDSRKMTEAENSSVYVQSLIDPNSVEKALLSDTNEASKAENLATPLVLDNPASTPLRSPLDESIPITNSPVTTKSRLSEIKNDVIDNLLADEKTSATRVDDVSENLNEMNNLPQIYAPKRSPSATPTVAEALLVSAPPPPPKNNSMTVSNEIHPHVPTVVVPDDADVELDSIVLRLTEQVRKGKSQPIVKLPGPAASANVDFLRNPISIPPVSADVVYVGTPALHSKNEAENHLPSPGATPPSGVVSALPVLDGAIPQEKALLHPNTGTKEHEFDNRCKKNVTGGSLTALLNETSLTQMMEEVAKDENGQFGFGIPPKKENQGEQHFRTISPTAGIFSIFEKTNEKSSTENQPAEVAAADNPTIVYVDPPIVNMVDPPIVNLVDPPIVNIDIPVVTSVPLESDIATQNLKAWLNSSSTTKEVTHTVKPNRRSVVTVCRTLDFLLPGSSRSKGKKIKPTSIKRRRKILPKLPLSSSQSTPIAPAPTKIPHKPLSFKDNIIDLTPTFNKVPLNDLINGTFSTSVMPTFVESKDILATTSQLQIHQPQETYSFITVSSSHEPITKPDLYQTLANTKQADLLATAAAATIQVNPSVLVPAVPDNASVPDPTPGHRLSAFSDVVATSMFLSTISSAAGPLISSANCRSDSQSVYLTATTTLATSTEKSPRVSSKLSSPSSKSLAVNTDVSSPAFQVAVVSSQHGSPSTQVVSSQHGSPSTEVVSSAADSQPEVFVPPRCRKTSTLSPNLFTSADDSTETIDESACSSPRFNSDRATVADSSEEHSLRIITSDEEKLTLGSSRKRKHGHYSSPKKPKKPRLEEFEKSSMSDLVSFLKKIHSQDDKNQRKKHKEKPAKHRKSDSDKVHRNGKVSRSSKPVSDESNERDLEVCDEKVKAIQSSEHVTPKKNSSPRKKHKKHCKNSPFKIISPLKKEKKTKRRVSLTSIPIPPSKLGGSPLHLRTPSPALVCRDSPNTIALVAESLVELSRSRGSTHDSNLVFKQFPSPLTNKQPHDVAVENRSSPSKSPQHSSKRKKKTKKRLSLEDVNISEFLSTIKYD